MWYDFFSRAQNQVWIIDVLVSLKHTKFRPELAADKIDAII